MITRLLCCHQLTSNALFNTTKYSSIRLFFWFPTETDETCFHSTTFHQVSRDFLSWHITPAVYFCTAIFLKRRSFQDFLNLHSDYHVQHPRVLYLMITLWWKQLSSLPSTYCNLSTCLVEIDPTIKTLTKVHPFTISRGDIQTHDFQQCLHKKKEYPIHILSLVTITVYFPHFQFI